MPKKPAKKRPAPPTLPPDLVAHIHAVKGFAQIHNLLTQGHYPHQLAPAITQSVAFLKALHEHSLAVAKKHPQAHLSSELQAIGGPDGPA